MSTTVSGTQADDRNPEVRRLEAALLESEARFRSVFETSGAGIVTVRGDATITYVNHAFADMLGFAPDELVGRRLLSLTLPEEGNPVSAGIAALRAGEITALTMERTYVRRDGAHVYVKTSIHMLKLLPEMIPEQVRDKTLTRFVGITQDITGRKVAEAQVRESQRLLQEAQHLGKIGHWTWHPATNAVSWSDEMCRILGIAPGASPTEFGPFENYVMPEDLARFQSAVRALIAGEIIDTMEYRIRQSSGEIRDVVGRTMPERNADGTLLRIVGTIQDITDRKRDETILREAMVSAETANRAKTRFLASMSHELRTPLNAILGFAQLLALKSRGPLTAEQDSYVANIMQGGEQLLHLIADVLDLARIDTGKLFLNLQPTSLSAMVETLIAEFAAMADARGITLAFENGAPADMAIADPLRLRQVAVNLTSNAIKYNRSRGRVVFRIQAGQSNLLRLAVVDTGRGIARERQGEVFESFNRLGAESTGEEGTGIGLSLSKRLIEEMGGAIGFTSAVDQGSTFWIELPRATPDDSIPNRRDAPA